MEIVPARCLFRFPSRYLLDPSGGPPKMFLFSKCPEAIQEVASIPIWGLHLSRWASKVYLLLSIFQESSGFWLQSKCSQVMVLVFLFQFPSRYLLGPSKNVFGKRQGGLQLQGLHQ